VYFFPKSWVDTTHMRMMFSPTLSLTSLSVLTFPRSLFVFGGVYLGTFLSFSA